MTNTLLKVVAWRYDVAEENEKMNRIQVVLLSLCLPFWLTACVSNTVKDESSPFYSVPAGSTLTLNRDITVPGGKVAVYVQDGKLLGYNDVDWYRPNCKFELYTMSEQPRQVSADSFRITKVVDEIESSSLQGRVQYANMMLGFGIDQSRVFNYATMMHLHSELQPDVFRMTCQHWEDIADDRYDGALCVGVMGQHVGPHALEEILRIIVPGGGFCFSINERAFDSCGFRDRVTALEREDKVRCLSLTHGPYHGNEGIDGWICVLRKTAIG